VAHANLNELPTKTIAFFLLLGFLIMLFVEEVIAPQGSHSHSSAALPALSTPANVVEFDAEMADLDKTSTSARDSPTSSKAIQGFVDREKAFSLLLGLTIHAAADGIALGAANLEKAGETAALSFVVFFALAVHKGTGYRFYLSFLRILNPSSADIAGIHDFSFVHRSTSTRMPQVPAHILLLDAFCCIRLVHAFLMAGRG